MTYFMNINLVFEANSQKIFGLARLSNQIRRGFESGKSTGMILIDLQNGFDTLDHDIILDKMKCLGFTSKTIDWFGSYLKTQNIVKL